MGSSLHLFMKLSTFYIKLTTINSSISNFIKLIYIAITECWDHITNYELSPLVPVCNGCKGGAFVTPEKKPRKLRGFVTVNRIGLFSNLFIEDLKKLVEIIAVS
jgi:hypothetical protein